MPNVFFLVFLNWKRAYLLELVLKFDGVINDLEQEVWTEVISKFLGKNKDKNWKHTVRNMLIKFKDLIFNMSLEFYFLKSHWIIWKYWNSERKAGWKI